MIASSWIRVLAVVSVALLCIAPALGAPPKGPPASSAKGGDAKSLLAEAQTAMKEERFADAVATLRHADEVDPSPGTKLALARALDKAGKLGEAIVILQGVIDGAGTAKTAKAKALAQPAKQLLADVEGRVPRLSIVVTGTGSTRPTITLNGKKIDGGAELTLDPGTFLVAAEAKGYYRVAKKIKLGPGDHEKLELKMKPAK